MADTETTPATHLGFWRCHNPKCTPAGAAMPGFDFEHPVGTIATCPKCGLRADHERHGRLIVPLVVLHWETPDEIVQGGGSGLAACTGKALAGRHTRVPAVANCPACRATDAWKAAVKAVETHPDYHVPVELVKTKDGPVLQMQKS